MEVHHHSHTTPAHGGTARKKWSHYFWEFFMLFLAVFAGFMAENWREHFIEHKRAKQFAVSVFNDLKADTASLKSTLLFTAEKINHIDSLTNDLHLETGAWNDTALTTHFLWLIRSQIFERSKTTYEQLKNSGTLRYFNQSIIKMLNQYDVDAAEIDRRENSELNVLLTRVVVKVMETINMEVVYDKMFQPAAQHAIFVKIKDRDRAEYLINEAIGVKILRTRLLALYQKLLSKAEEIISVLKKEYHLK